ncbi:MAG: HNH endonuclease [Calditrichaeota bacterium]|nr:MAG: HNH endonuclease [Calditrichota bacterium]
MDSYSKRMKITNNIEFTPKQKKEIFKRDDFRCVICGKREPFGEELQIGLLKPKDKNSSLKILDSVTLCNFHYLNSKNCAQTETGKKMFIRLYEKAKVIGDSETANFCAEILEVFEKNEVNGHIEWKK